MAVFWKLIRPVGEQRLCPKCGPRTRWSPRDALQRYLGHLVSLLRGRYRVS
jgi:hypothetical protein